jgi:metal-responsive CopG/Arc/MetJ family transcriptional regulator
MGKRIQAFDGCFAQPRGGMIRSMKRIVKVAISLPEDLLVAVDQARNTAGTTRSGFFRDAVKAQLQLGATSEVDRYVAAYRAEPEGAEEVAAAMASAVHLLAAEPFE